MSTKVNSIDKIKNHIVFDSLSFISSIAQWISRICLLTMTVIIGWQVFARYILNSSPSWSESTSVLLMGWFVLVGAGAGVRYKDHLGFTVALILMPPRLRKLVSIFGHILVGLFGFGMFFFGMDLIMGTWDTRMPGSFLPQGAHYIPLSVGGTLIFIFSLEKLFEEFTNKEGTIPWSK